MKRHALMLALATGVLAGCASAPWDEDGAPRRAEAQPAHREYPGVVEAVREVEIDSARTGIAPMVGAVIGGAAGGRVGSGRGSAAGAVVGTVAGAVAGEAAAQAGTQPGVEITVRLGAGRVIAVTQPAGTPFRPGERVRVVSDGREARVVKSEDPQ